MKKNAKNLIIVSLLITNLIVLMMYFNQRNLIYKLPNTLSVILTPSDVNTTVVTFNLNDELIDLVNNSQNTILDNNDVGTVTSFEFHLPGYLTEQMQIDYIKNYAKRNFNVNVEQLNNDLWGMVASN